ncbi:unnamed protein product, partial [Vitis vinifera]
MANRGNWFSRAKKFALMTKALMNSSLTNIAGFLSRENDVDGDSVGQQRLKENHHLIVFHVIAAEDENALGHLVSNRVRKRVIVGVWAFFM